MGLLASALAQATPEEESSLQEESRNAVVPIPAGASIHPGEPIPLEDSMSVADTILRRVPILGKETIPAPESSLEVPTIPAEESKCLEESIPSEESIHPTGLLALALARATPEEESSLLE